MTLSVVIITFNEEQNLPRTLKSVEGMVRELGGEIIVVDSGSTDRTVEIAKSFGAKVFVEEWKGFASQKNSAIDKASGDWVLLLDADEEISPELAKELVGRESQPPYEWCLTLAKNPNAVAHRAYRIRRKNLFLGRWIRHGGFWPDPKLRLFRRGCARVEDRAVHETLKVDSATLHETVDVNATVGTLVGPLIHHAYPTLTSYIEHMNRYSSLGAEMVGPRGFNLLNIYIRPQFTFFYNYFLRLGFLDGKEGLLLHLYHAVYVSWKYAKAWELSRKPRG